MEAPDVPRRACSALDLEALPAPARRRRRRRAAARCSRRRPSRASAGSTGSTTTWCAPTRSTCPGIGARRRARQGHGPRAGAVGRRQRPLLLPRSVPRRDARGRRGGAQRRVRRRACRSARPTASTSATRSGRRSCGSSREAVEGIGDACRALDVPITGGNVSLYNETDGRAIYPDAGHRRRRPARARRSRA